MKKVFKIALLFLCAAMVVSCRESEDDITPIRDYAEQYIADKATLETFLKTHSMTVVNHPGFSDDQDVSFTSVAALAPNSIWGTDPNNHSAAILEWPVQKDGITYIIYYLQLRQGTGANSKSPCNLDGVLTSYTGHLADDDATVFESNNFPQSYFNLNNVIRGWSEIFPKFKTGNYTSNSSGGVDYSDFGAGVMFIPSGLAYYSNSPVAIGSAYQPLVFSFKLFEVQRVDNDGDGVFSYQEDLNGDGYIRDYDDTGSYADDTDRDGVPDAFDVDDDGDGRMTRDEIKYTLAGVTYSYPFNGAAVNDPATPQDETEGIPSCSGDKTTPTRLRKHLDPSCQ